MRAHEITLEACKNGAQLPNSPLPTPPTPPHTDLYFEVYVNRPAITQQQQQQPVVSVPKTSPMSTQPASHGTETTRNGKRKRDVYENGSSNESLLLKQDKLSTELNSLQSAFDNHLLEFKNNLKSLDEFKSGSKTQFSTRDQVQEFEKRINGKIQIFEQQFVTLNQQLEKYHQEALNQDINSSLAKQQESITENKKQIQQQVEHLTQLQDNMKRYDSVHDSLREDLASLKTNFESFVARSESKTEETKMDISPEDYVSSSSFNKLQEQFNQKFTETQSTIDEKHKTLTESLNEHKKHFQESTDAQSKQIANQMETSHKQHQEEWNQFKEQQQKQFTTLDDNLTEVRKTGQDSLSLAQKLEETVETKLSSFKPEDFVQQDMLSNELKEQRTQLENLVNEQLSTLKKQLEQRIEEALPTNEQVQNVDKQVKEEIEQQLNSHTKTYNDAMDKLRDELLSSVKKQYQDYAEEHIVPSIKQQVEQLETKIQKTHSNHLSRLEEAEKSIKDTMTNVGGLESELSNYKADSDEKIDSLNKMSNMSESMQAVEEQVNGLRKEFTTQLESLLKKQQSMQEAIDSLTTENASLKAALDKKEQQQSTADNGAPPTKRRRITKAKTESDPEEADKMKDEEEEEPEAPVATTTVTRKTKRRSRSSQQTSPTPRKTRRRSATSRPATASEEEPQEPATSQQNGSHAFKIVFSGFKDDTEYGNDLKARLEEIVTSLGAQVGTEGDYPEKITHVVSPPNLRTLKTLGASVSGIYICQPEWLLECEEKKKFISCDNHSKCHLYPRKLLNKKIGFSKGFMKSSGERRKHAKDLISWGGGEISENLDECDIILVARGESTKAKSKYPNALVYKWDVWMDNLLFCGEKKKKGGSGKRKRVKA